MMPEATMLEIAKSYLFLIIAYWWVLVPGVLMPLPDIYRHFLHPKGKELAVPRWLRLTIVVVCLFLAQFLAYRNQTMNLAKVIQEKRLLSIKVNDLAGRTQGFENLATQERSTIRNELGRLLAQNNDIRKNCTSDRPPSGFSCVKEQVRWLRQARRLIQKNMEPSYLARFDGASATELVFYRIPSHTTLSEEDNKAMNILTIKARALDDFIKDLQN